MTCKPTQSGTLYSPGQAEGEVPPLMQASGQPLAGLRVSSIYIRYEAPSYGGQCYSSCCASLSLKLTDET